MDLLRGKLFLLLTVITLVPVTVQEHGGVLRRQKRNWILAPRNLDEGQDYTTYDFVARIRSDKETNKKIFYYLSGPGADQDPVGRFTVNRDTGYIKVHSILDREEIAQYNLTGLARYSDGTLAEKDIALLIKVVDINDCPPVIKAQQIAQVNEHSKLGTVVMKVIATDDDDSNTENAKIFYRIDERSNRDGMFTINSQTGEVMIAKTSLDRETQDTYKLTIIASDLNGKAGGNTGTGEIEIKLTDINDNIPTLEKETYEGKIEENTVGVEVLRIQAVDLDLINTTNWFAMYEIVSGNEAGYFQITTDKKTNEGVITVTKALDYEEIKTVNLGVKVKNEAEYNYGSSMIITGASTSKPYPIKIDVINQKEAPKFQPNVKVVTISEEKNSISLSKVIATYTATDSDTLKTATNVRYAKLFDKDNWISIDEKTAEIKLNKFPDRESKFLVNGTYYAKIICITNEVPSKTATGTIAIQVDDFNDHCPTLTSTTQTMCFGDSVIYVTAEDKDMFPNSAPFEFIVKQEDSNENWFVEPYNATTVLLRDKGSLWPGTYKVSLEIKDQQGKSCDEVQIVDLTVCACKENTKTCSLRSKGSSSSFGAGGILLMLLGLLLLLLIPLLLLACLCGSAARDFKAIPFDAKENLISYHTEGQGEDKEVSHLQVPVSVDSDTINKKDIDFYARKGYFDHLVNSEAAFGGRGGGTMTAEDMHMYSKYNYNYSTGQNLKDFMGTTSMAGQDMSMSQYRSTAFDGMALPGYYLQAYYFDKLNQSSQQQQEKDSEMIYNYEGQESLAGSVGCCSLLENENDLAFLDDLGPKFKTLAEICQGTTLESSYVDIGVSNLSKQTVSTARPSTSTHTHVHTHTDTFRDRDHMNVSNLNVSNEASGSSVIIEEEKVTKSSQRSATLSNVQEKVVIPNQTLLIQQPPMYYAATPMYVVESKPQMVLVSGGTQQLVGQVGQAGLSQGLIQVGGIQGSQGMMVVEGQVGMNGASGQVAQGLSQGITESSQVLFVENGSAGQKHSTHYMQSSGQVPQRFSEVGFDVGGKEVHLKSFSAGSRGSAGSKEDFATTTTPRFQGGQRVVVQRKKVSVTERNVESST
ncbi:PREDICTED: desmoglein-2-like isoform X1 [Cyprinodon variegatus]|uniref:Desmoglein-2-like n=1 Tax=Cyprinodon variegatus TaxID=28743 RepID=A0A3Q2EIL3_CYPVA|nr:PREDICTED: desmoglein-2-like isoform X1 [Cyprinodon variegatus]